MVNTINNIIVFGGDIRKGGSFIVIRPLIDENDLKEFKLDDNNAILKFSNSFISAEELTEGLKSSTVNYIYQIPYEKYIQEIVRVKISTEVPKIIKEVPDEFIPSLLSLKWQDLYDFTENLTNFFFLTDEIKTRKIKYRKLAVIKRVIRTETGQQKEIKAKLVITPIIDNLTLKQLSKEEIDIAFISYPSLVMYSNSFRDKLREILSSLRIKEFYHYFSYQNVIYFDKAFLNIYKQKDEFGILNIRFDFVKGYGYTSSYYEVYFDVIFVDQFTPELTKKEEKPKNVIYYTDVNYPKRLKEFKIIAPLHYKGNLDLLKSKSVAVIGSRDTPKKGLELTEIIVKELVNNGINIISGYADGVDITAHNSALENGGTTTIVLPYGMDTFSPNKLKIQDWNRILVISQFNPDWSWSVDNAMARNEVICLLSSAVIAIYISEESSGTLYGVNYAIEKKIPVFIVDPEFFEGKGRNKEILNKYKDVLNENIFIINPKQLKASIEQILNVINKV